MTRSKRVITVGLDPGNRLSGLLATLRDHGYQVVELPTFEGLFPVLNRYPEAVILAYGPAGQSTIHELLQTTIPVIVLVDRSDFDEYYEWMCAGAFDYFELDSDPQWIEHSVRCASARVAAAA
jgi:DNA-binding NtrC family response regulator